MRVNYTGQDGFYYFTIVGRLLRHTNVTNNCTAIIKTYDGCNYT